MIKALELKNFKSIRHLQLECTKVNVFIGKPNTGKSNRLESIGIFSFPYAPDNLKSQVRFESMTDLFYDHELGENINSRLRNFENLLNDLKSGSEELKTLENLLKG